MLEENQRKLLVSAVQGNAAVLFLGAGFSADAKNSLGETLPNSRRLAEVLWGYLEYAVPYDETDLQTVFEAALKSPKGHTSLRALLESQLLCSSIPQWYELVRSRYWYRIYTTNADDLLEQVYRAGGGPTLDVVNGRRDDYRDRDQFLSRIQYIKLNGSLPGSPADLTFSTRQYAARLAEHDVWYDHFVRDYANHVTLLVGTNLNEPLFSQYVAAREKRLADPGGHLPGAFLVSPRISPAKADALQD
jgi:SIR2-like protein